MKESIMVREDGKNISKQKETQKSKGCNFLPLRSHRMAIRR